MGKRGGGGLRGREPIERFNSFVKPSENGCLLWQGCLNSRGYGCFCFGGKGRTVLAHRWAYENIRGEAIPDGMTIDHLCRQRRCVNTEHLEVVPLKENILRGTSPTAVNARASVCKHGHELVGENVIVRSDGRRRCRTCGILNARAWRAARSEQEVTKATIAQLVEPRFCKPEVARSIRACGSERIKT